MDLLFEILGRPGASAGAILVSALVAALGASFTILMNRKTTRDRETVVLIDRFSWDRDYLQAKDEFIRLRDGIGLQACCENPDSEDARAVNKIMNHYELLSIGINRGILSGKIYADFYKGRFVKDFEAAQSYIHRKREQSGRKELFTQFEKLAKKWRNEIDRNGGT